MKDANLNEYFILLKFAEKLDVTKNQNSSDYVIKLLKNRDRVQKLLRASLKKDKLNDFPEEDVELLINRNMLKAVGEDQYILTIKGMLKAIALLKDDKSVDSEIYQEFLDRYFESEFQIEPMASNLTDIEKTWLLSMIFLNCFDEGKAIDILFNETNKGLYVDLFNRIGLVLKENGYAEKFTPLEKEKEFLRRDLEKINKKLYNIEFSKTRDKFYINLQKERKTTLIYVFHKIFSKVDGSKLSLDDIQKIRDLEIECEPLFFKVKRRKEEKKLLQPDPVVEEALKSLI